MQILLIRHGESLWNRQGRMQGQLDSPLTETGRLQAQRLAQHLKQIEFAALYSSDSGRALSTAREVADATGHEILVDNRLRERHFGVFEGLTGDEMKARYPEAYACYRSGDPAYCIPDGESMLAFRERVMGCLQEIAVRHLQAPAVVVTHGLVLDAVYRVAYGIASTEPRTFRLVNAGINRVSLNNGVWRIELWGDDSHLDGALTSGR